MNDHTKETAIGIIRGLVHLYLWSLLLLCLTGKSWSGVFFFGAILLVLHLSYKAFELARKRQVSREKLISVEKQHVRGQENCRKDLLLACERSLALFEALPDILNSAEKSLDEAELFFAKNSYIPFWSRIEKIAQTLAKFEDNIRRINVVSNNYVEMAKGYEGIPPKFPLVAKSVEASLSTATAGRLSALVQRAHCDRDFASIYLQLRTNQILIDGFGNLAQALDQVEWQIATSIEELSESLNAAGLALATKVDKH